LTAKVKNSGEDFHSLLQRSRKESTARETREVLKDLPLRTRPHGPGTDVGHPRDVDPSITGQSHRVTGKVPDSVGIYRARTGNPADVLAAVPRGTAATLCRSRRPPQYGAAEPPDRRTSRSIPGANVRRHRPAPSVRPLVRSGPWFGQAPGSVRPRFRQAAPLWSASQTAALSRTPSSAARPQCAIQAASPSGVPDAYPLSASP